MANLRRLLLLMTFVLSIPLVQAETIRVAVASNFAPIIKQLQSDFESATPHKLIFSAGSSGVLFAQISKGAPFDIFLSADSQRPVLLEQQGKIKPGSRHTYARGRLVWWQPDNNALSLTTLHAFTGRLAIANPRFAPYGQAAMDALASLQLNNLSLVRGANVSQTFQFVDTGNAMAGLVPLSLIRSKSFTSHGQPLNPKYQRYIVIPANWHRDIAQQLVIIKSSKKIQAALEFSQFLLSNDTQQQLAKLGYQPL